MKVLLGAIVAFVVLGTGLFFLYSNYESLRILLEGDAGLAIEMSTNLLMMFAIASAVAIVFASLLAYSILTTRTSARRMAYRISKDLSLSKEQFRQFYELSPVPYLLVNKKGDIIRPNKASLRLFSLPEEELVGKNIFEYLSDPEHPEKISRYKTEVARNVPIDQKEVQLSLPDGLRWSLLSVAELKSSGHKDQGLVTLVDIHEQKELERIKTEFLSLASHQLRAPLANLKWYIDFLLNRRKDALNDEVEGYLHKMFRRNEDMIDLVNTLLNISRIEMGRVQAQKEVTDLSEIANGVVEELEPSAKDKKISIVREYEDKLVYNTDGRLVRIIFQNLLSNALRYTKEGGHVTLRMKERKDGVVFEVQDTGVGIPPEEQAHIFQKLYRASNAKEMEVNGNGIGLYMCKALAEGLGGNISFKSVVGEGTVFTVVL